MRDHHITQQNRVFRVLVSKFDASLRIIEYFLPNPDRITGNVLPNLDRDNKNANLCVSNAQSSHNDTWYDCL